LLYLCFTKGEAKVKLITGTEGSRRLRFPDFMTVGQ
jgi:hypothetical protein